MSTGNRIARGSLIMLLGQAAASLQGLITLPIVIRLAGEATYGAYVLLVNLTVFLGLFVSTLPYHYRRHVASITAPNDRRRLFEHQLTLQTLMFGTAAGLYLVAGPDIERGFLGEGVKVTTWLLVVWLGAYLLTRQVVDYFRYTERFTPFSLLSGVGPYVFVALLVTAAIARAPMSVDLLVKLQIVTQVLIAAPWLPGMLREIGVPRLRLSIRETTADIRLGLPLILEFVIDWVLNYSDRYLIAALMSVSDAGRYLPAYTVATIITFFPNLASSVLPPVLSRMVDRGEKPKAEQLLSSFARLFLMLAVPFAAGAMMVGPSIVNALTTHNIAVASRWVTPFVALASLFLGMAYFLSLAAFVLGRTQTILGSYALGASLNVGLNIILLPRVQDIAIAGATTLIGYSAGCFSIALALRPVWRLRMDWPAIARISGAALVMAALLWLLGYRPGEVAGWSILVILGSVVLAAIAYVAALIMLGGFRRDDRQMMLGLLSFRREGAVPSASLPKA